MTKPKSAGIMISVSGFESLLRHHRNGTVVVRAASLATRTRTMRRFERQPRL